MSSWTYVNGIIGVIPRGATVYEQRYVLETVLNHLPRVYGSEGNMSVEIIQTNRIDGYPIHYNEFSEYISDGLDDLNAWFSLRVSGSLRDTVFDDTLRGFQKWLCRLAKRVRVEDVLVKVYDGYLKPREQIIDFGNISFGRNPYKAMYEMPSADKSTNWCDYLVDWETVKNTNYPKKLWEYHKNVNDVEFVFEDD